MPHSQPSSGATGLFMRTRRTEVSFERLIPHRVRDILVVASSYDAFVIEEGGRLTELILNEYVSLNLSDGPRVTRVASADEALILAEHQRFDLIITMSRVGSLDGLRLAKRLKSIDSSTPIVLLAFDLGELERLKEETQTEHAVDHVFLWSGDARLFIAIIKMLEDRWNADHDTEVAQVRTILLVEDSIRFTSLYLPLLFTVLVKQTHLLMDDGVNLANRLLRLRARPKVLLARDYEEAIGLYERYRPYMLGVISDKRFPRDGAVDADAGLELLRRIKHDDPTMPMLLQSSDESASRLARELGVHFINKRSRKLLKEVKVFVERHFGFGDFVFLVPDGSEWGRARNLRELEDQLQRVPSESLRYHALRNDFSNWLRARTEFGLASRIRPFQIEDFDTIDALRRYLVETLRAHRVETQRGIVTDFAPTRFDERSPFVRIGHGSLGGKGRGLAFANAMLQHHEMTERFAGVNIVVPRTAVIATDVFEQFLAENELLDLAFSTSTDEEISHRFVMASLPLHVKQDLESFLGRIEYPLAVRSSSVLEDSSTQPFAGIYSTYMVPNSHPDPSVRLAQLSRAIKLVYASTFSRAAKSYAESTGSRIEDEKMAVILQQVVGARHGDRFYPQLSGVARSFNFYPIPPMRGEEGIAVIALGLGRQVAAGLTALRFSPAHPRNVPAMSSVKDTLDNAQRRFFALDMSRPHQMPSVEEEGNLLHLDVADALDDETLAPLVSTYSAANDRLYEGLRKEGSPVLTFAPILNTNVFPLAAVLSELLALGERGMGSPIEMEFAVDLTTRPAVFGFLQLRRLAAGGEPEDVSLRPDQLAEAWCYSAKALGNGRRDDVADIVYVRPDHFDPSRTPEIAGQVGLVNRQLVEEGLRYVLVGPGRWGSSDPWLGIPVGWDQISGARAIVEASLRDFRVQPSQGTHFFQNVTSLRIAYFTVNPYAGEDRIDWDWLDSQPARFESEFVRHVRCARPLRIRIEGRSNRGVILPPAPAAPPEPEASDDAPREL